MCSSTGRRSLCCRCQRRRSDEYSVTLRYDATALPIWNLLPLPLPSHTITYTSLIRLGGL